MTVLKFPTIPKVREQVADVMKQESAWESYMKARKAFAEAQERNRRTVEMMRWYGRKDKPEPNDAA